MLTPVKQRISMVTMRINALSMFSSYLVFLSKMLISLNMLYNKGRKNVTCVFMGY